MDAMDLVVMSYVFMNSLWAVLLYITDVPTPQQHDDDGPHLLSEET